MKIVKVTYTVHSAFAARNQENINTFIGDLRRINDPGLRYIAYLGEDGKSFTHFASYEDEASQNMLFELESFKSFQKERDESGFEIPHRVETMHLVASSFDVFS